MKSLLKFFVLLTGLICSVKTQQDCGKSTITTGLIIGADEYSLPGQWPWLASVFSVNLGDENRRENFVCGATLISNSHVLTAAHCVQEKLKSVLLTTENTQIYLGRTNFSDPNEKFETRGASQIFVHPDWNHLSEKFDADIAIMKLTMSVDFSDFIQPACMPVEFAGDFAGIVAGYGLTEHSTERIPEQSPKHIEIPSVSQETCFLENPEYAKLGSKRTFCGGERGKIPCNGDSGGGFYSKSSGNDQFRVVGIVSASAQKEGKCDPDHPALFTNVVKFIDWIYEKVPELKPKKPEPVWYSYKNENRIRHDVVFVQEGTVKAYIGRRWHESRLIVGKFIVEWNSFYMPYFGKELSFTDGDFELLEISGGSRWVPINGQIPPNAVEGGHEDEVKLYIGKKLHNGADLVGKVTSNNRKIYVSYFGKEIGFDGDFHVLVIEDKAII